MYAPVEEGWAHHVYHLYVIRTNERDNLRRFLLEKGIQTGVHYPTALPDLQAYSGLKIGNGANFIASTLAKEILSLPMGDQLTVKDAMIVSDCVRKFYS